MRSVWCILLLCTSVLNMHNFSPFPMAACVFRAPNSTFLNFSKIKNRLNFLMWFSIIVHQRDYWGKIWANPKYLSWPKIFDIYWQLLLIFNSATQLVNLYICQKLFYLANTMGIFNCIFTALFIRKDFLSRKNLKMLSWRALHFTATWVVTCSFLQVS